MPFLRIHTYVGCVTIPCNGITLANDMGKRRKKLTLHTPSPKDPIFEAFPDYENETCNSCPKVVSDKTSKPKVYITLQL
jgi:hypothetical protein